MNVDDLIRELETAPEGTRQLSDKVMLAYGWQREWTVTANRPNPTKSVDDAVSLLPEGWRWSIISGQPGFTAQIWSPDARYRESGPNQGGTYEAHLVAGKDASSIQRATPALALCAAILKTKL